jgi:hypothetical protein
MVLNDEIKLLVATTVEDENLDTIEVHEWVTLGRCAIIQNSSARRIALNDGQEYAYSYEVFFRNKNGLRIPKEGDTIHLTKKDGTIYKDCKVTGFVTLKNWVKLWV